MSADLGPGTDVTPDLPTSETTAGAEPPSDTADSQTGGMATGDGAPQDEGARRPATSDPEEFHDDPTLDGLGGADRQGGGAG